MYYNKITKRAMSSQETLSREQKPNNCWYAIFDNHFQFVATPRHLIIGILSVAVLLLILFIVTLALCLSVKATEVVYASNSECTSPSSNPRLCEVRFNISQQMKAPIYVLYSLKNMYVNHRRYLNSFSVEQLKGKVIDLNLAHKECGPIIFNKDLPFNNSWNGSPLVKDEIASPCGLKPRGYFSDIIRLSKIDGTPIQINRNLPKQTQALETQRAPDSENKQWVDVTDQRFKKYMEDSSLMTKQRVWGVISTSLAPGEYKLQATNTYEMPGLQIGKGVFLTTASAMGGRQVFFPIAFGVGFILCIAYVIFIKLSFKNFAVTRHNYKELQSKYNSLMINRRQN